VLGNCSADTNSVNLTFKRLDLLPYYSLGGALRATVQQIPNTGLVGLAAPVTITNTVQPLATNSLKLPLAFGPGEVMLVKVQTAALVFLVQPESQTVVAGSNVVLSVTVGGEAPIVYQWQIGGTNIVGATNSTLTLSGVQPTDAGNYTVVVSNAFGCVTSCATGLRIVPILGCGTGTNGLTLSWTGSYVLQSAINVAGPFDDVPGASSPYILALTSGSQRFFRLRAALAGQVGPSYFTGNAQFQINVSGLPGYYYVVQASTNLLNWFPFQTNPAPFVFVDTNSANYPCRFYRTVLAP